MWSLTEFKNSKAFLEFGHLFPNLFKQPPNLPYSGSKFLVVKASSLIESKRQGSKSCPVFRIAGVSTCENVAPGLLIQKPQHSLIFYLLRSETMTTIIISDSRKSSLKPTQHFVCVTRLSSKLGLQVWQCLHNSLISKINGCFSRELGYL